MIKEFVDAWFAHKHELEALFREQHPESYGDILKPVIGIMSKIKGMHVPDPERITTIDHGSYSGTLVYVIAEKGYDPDVYWYVRISYGSCSGCDTLENLRDYIDSKPTDAQVKGYMTLALHIVQQLKQMDGEDV